MVVVFKEADSWWWWKPFLRKGFSHCIFIDSVCADHFWLIVDPNKHYTHIECVPKKLKPTIEDLIEDECIIVPVKQEIDLNSVCYTLCLNNCVDTVKRILGIRATFCITPYQLYKRLTDGIAR
ncbi:MAG: hypothetical protein ACXQTI_02780 [Candidatus Nezhaarchaeales archaeon]